MACTIFTLFGHPVLYQWDTGRQLSVTDPAGFEIHKVHFGNGDTALVVDVDRDTMTVNIPNSLLQRSGQIRVYAMNQAENSEVTIHSHTLFIRSREKPEDYVESEDEIKRWDDLEGRISKLEQGGTGGGSTTIDPTLSISGAAADAKATGEQLAQNTQGIAELKGNLSEVNNTTEEPVAAGKVWTSTANGAGWSYPQEGSGWVKVADITYNSNKEVVVESIDYESGVITSTNHGLQDGENVFFVPNGIYKYSPEKYMPVGTLTGTEYKVTNATDNTFSLGGVTMTANQEIDFTKWHIETNGNYGSSVFIKNLKLLNDVKVISYGKTVSISNYTAIAIADNNIVSIACGEYEGKIPNPNFYDGFGDIGYEIFRGNIFGCCETVITRIDKTHIRSEITALSSNSKNSTDWGVNSNITHAVAIAECLESAKHPTELNYWNFGPANGYRIEVYTK